MSELKAINLNSMGCYNINEPIYLKSEADAVIEELKEDYKEACDRLQTANIIKDEQLAAARHHKYKRCLAIARWCRYWAIYWDGCIPNDCGMFIAKSKFYHRWYKRWLKISEKFKPNNEVNNA